MGLILFVEIQNISVKNSIAWIFKNRIVIGSDNAVARISFENHIEIVQSIHEFTYHMGSDKRNLIYTNIDYFRHLLVIVCMFNLLQWNNFSNVKDINSVLEVTVFDEDRDHKVEFLGKVSIPLLRIRNGEKRWYCLKDKKLHVRAKGNCPMILLEMNVVWNPVRLPDFFLFFPLWSTSSKKFTISGASMDKNVEPERGEVHAGRSEVQETDLR